MPADPGRVFLTGGTGFIGEGLARSLAEQGYEVRALVRSLSRAESILDSRVTLIEGDLDDREALAKGMEGCDHVFHLAGYARAWSKDPAVFYRVNVKGFENVLNAAEKAGITRVVHTSTAGAIGPSTGQPVTEDSPRTVPPTTEYERTKAQAEELVPRYLDRGLDIVVVNPTRVFGPGQLNQSNAVTILIRDYARGKWRLIPGDGERIGNYVFVEDVIDGHLRALHHGTPGKRYILGGENLTYNALFEMLSQLSEAKQRMINVPVPAIMALARFQQWKANTFGGEPLITPGFARKYLYDWETDHTRAEKELGYKARSFRNGARITLDWLAKTQ